jgi:hypothetical protein
VIQTAFLEMNACKTGRLSQSCNESSASFALTERLGAGLNQLKAAMMQSSPLAIVTMRRDLSARYASTTRQWLAARNAYRRLHEQPVKNIIALRDAAQRLDQLDRGRAALLRDLKALSD